MDELDLTSVRVRSQLRNVAQKLDITAGVIRSQLALLRDRSGDIDADVAVVLQHAVVTPLYEETERVRVLLAEVCVFGLRPEARDVRV
jgi:hypothetical protein